MRRFDHVDGDGFNNRFANLRHATDLRISATSAAVKARPPLRRHPWRQHRDQDQHQHQHEPDAGVPRAPRNTSIGASASAGE
jgi:hypothetical protein